jgi:hypothetical protein
MKCSEELYRKPDLNLIIQNKVMSKTGGEPAAADADKKYIVS